MQFLTLIIRWITLALEKWGSDVVLGGIVVGCFWKIATNHLKHIQDKVNDIDTTVKENKEKLDKFVEGFIALKAKCEETHKRKI